MRGRFDAGQKLAELVGRGAACGRFDIRIDADGCWHHEGKPIRRPELVKLFAKVLRRAPDGTYWLVTPMEQGRIEVQDVPFTVVELRAAGAGRAASLAFRTNLDEWVEAGPKHPLAMREGPAALGRIPYLTLEHGLEARLLRPVFYELVEHAELAPPPAESRIGVWSRGHFFDLGRGEE